VPGRVHSMPKSCGSQQALLPAQSNPLLTRGTVESAIRALVQQKKTLPSDFFKPVFAAAFQTAFCRPTQTCVFVL